MKETTIEPSILDEVRALLEAESGIEAAFVFGSAVSGNLRDDSDLDLALRYRDADSRAAAERGYLQFLGRLTRLARRTVQLVDMDRASLDLRRQVFLKGRVLFDRHPEKTREERVRTAIAYVDWAHARRIIDQGLDRRLDRMQGHG